MRCSFVLKTLIILEPFQAVFFAISTIGSIAGTFTGGFVLISLFGTNHTLMILGAVLFLLAIYVHPNAFKSFGIWGVLLLGLNYYYINKERNFLDFDTQYSRIFITNQESQFLYIDGFVNSGMFLNHPNQPVYEYRCCTNYESFGRPKWIRR